jgi:hypothetical protein
MKNSRKNLQTAETKSSLGPCRETGQGCCQLLMSGLDTAEERICEIRGGKTQITALATQRTGGCKPKTARAVRRQGRRE